MCCVLARTMDPSQNKRAAAAAAVIDVDDDDWDSPDDSLHY